MSHVHLPVETANDDVELVMNDAVGDQAATNQLKCELKIEFNPWSW